MQRNHPRMTFIDMEMTTKVVKKIPHLAELKDPQRAGPPIPEKSTRRNEELDALRTEREIIIRNMLTVHKVGSDKLAMLDEEIQELLLANS